MECEVQIPKYSLMALRILTRAIPLYAGLHSGKGFQLLIRWTSFSIYVWLSSYYSHIINEIRAMRLECDK